MANLTTFQDEEEDVSDDDESLFTNMLFFETTEQVLCAC